MHEATAELLKLLPHPSNYPIDLPNLVKAYKYTLVKKALEDHHGCKGRAAKSLGINRTTLVMFIKKMEKLGL